MKKKQVNIFSYTLELGLVVGGVSRSFTHLGKALRCKIYPPSVSSSPQAVITSKPVQLPSVRAKTMLQRATYPNMAAVSVIGDELVINQRAPLNGQISQNEVEMNVVGLCTCQMTGTRYLLHVLIKSINCSLSTLNC